MRGILDHEQTVLARELAQLTRLARMARVGDGDERASPRANGSSRRVGRQPWPVLAANIREHRGRSGVDDRRRGRCEGQGRQHDLVSGGSRIAAQISWSAAVPLATAIAWRAPS